ncbi:MAG: methyltransferase domain-containing protein [Nitrospirota bacterium]|nr:methyltransferase domain-containing protein [Nitrospirota bacterium]
MVRLICPVRGCGKPLEPAERALACENRHTFDIAKSGYVNLLQPQDRRSPNPGDSKEMVQARRRFVDRGHAALLAELLWQAIGDLGLPAGFSLLDAGCGEGYFPGIISSHFPEADIRGVDISVPAIDAAARKYPNVRWLVANADRFLPFVDGSFDVVMSITARKNSAEFRRIISPTGRLLVAVPGEDDQIELREAVLGKGVQKDRTESTLSHFADHFALEEEIALRYTAHLNAEGLSDLFALSYRGARRQATEQLARISRLDVTLSYRLFRFKVRT